MEQFIEALLALAGAFIVYYWLTIGDLGKSTQQNPKVIYA
jgi:hypothetical protein